LVRRKLTPFAQSSELPPPKATIESTPSGAAKARPRSTIEASGFVSNSWNRATDTPAASSNLDARST
jgi:hypothetical protein